jgi:hypothetical protein
MTNTEVVWTYEQQFDQQLHTNAQAKLAQMLQEGKTNGAISRTYLPDNTWKNIREWTNLTDAQEWIAFVQNYNPISATIVG